LLVTPIVSPTIFRQQIPQISGIQRRYSSGPEPNAIHGSASSGRLFGTYTGTGGIIFRSPYTES
jgi:hypothetical protein